MLTVDRPTATLIISQRGCPENTLYHALQPSVVQQWPHFCPDTTDDDFNSVEARRTLCVLGTVAAVPELAVEEVALVGIPLPAESASAAVEAAVAHPAVAHTPQSISSVRKARRCTPGKYDVWILRFASKVSYDVAVHMLREMPAVRFTERAARTCATHSEEQRYFYSTPLASSTQMTTAASYGQTGRSSRRLR